MAARPPDGPRSQLRPQAPLSWDRIRRQALETHEVSDAMADHISVLRKDKAISPVADLALTMGFCQLNMLQCLIDALKLTHDNQRDRDEINREWLQEQLKRHAGGDWFTST